MRVLVAEDEPLLAAAIAEWLRDETHAVDVAYDGSAALERLTVNDYDVLVLDRDLPVLHGDDVCRELVGSGSPTRILMLTAAAAVTDKAGGACRRRDHHRSGVPDPVNLLSRRITLRARLTLIYGGLFLVAGVLLLGATYALFSQQLGSSKLTVLLRGPEVKQSTPPATGSGKKQLFVLNKAGDVLTGADAERAIKDQQDGVRAAATKSLLTQGGIALLLVGGLAAGVGWLVAGRVLAPLHRVTDTARRIAAAPATACTNE